MLFTFATLPVEIGASGKVLGFVNGIGIIGERQTGARDVLKAAAWTYVAGALTALTTFLYYVFLSSGAVTDVPVAGPKPAISEIDPTQLAAWLDARGEPAYWSARCSAGAHRSAASSFDDLSDLPAGLRDALATEFRFTTIADSHVIGADGGLLEGGPRLADG